MNKTFAEGYTRNDDGLVLFPRDSDLRALLFPSLDPTEHVAKANLHMVKALIEFVSEPGETVLDPFAGTGTILVGATMNRKVICIEIEEHFQEIIERSIKSMKQDVPEIEELTTLIPGDCSKILPWSGIANHMIFSPPWANVLKKKSVDSYAEDWGYGDAAKYSADPHNIANLNVFLYYQKMEQVYKKFFQSLTPGGTMTIIIKDKMEAGKRLGLGERAFRDSLRIGFEPVEWNKWFSPGGAFSAVNRAKGQETVTDEDLITLRRPL